MNGDGQQSFMRWFVGQVLTVDFFKNTITLLLVMTFCTLTLLGQKPDAQFALLVGMVLGFYFKADKHA